MKNKDETIFKPITLTVGKEFLKEWNKLMKEAWEHLQNKASIPPGRIGKPTSSTTNENRLKVYTSRRDPDQMR